MNTGLANWTDTDPTELLEAHIHGRRSINTARSYAADMDTFREFLGVQTTVEAVEFLVNLSRGAAERTMDNYLAWLRNEKKYPALNTIRRKAQSIMGLLRRAHKYNVISWMIEPLKLPAPPPIRDTRGPKREIVLKMLDVCEARQDAKGARDAALLKLMAFGAYRCNEVLTLDLKHVDIPAREIEILAKGLWGRTRHPMPIEAAQAVERWLEFRGFDDGPLFTTHYRAGKEAQRLTYWGAYDIVEALGMRAGIKCSPHKLRHFAATEFLALTNGNIPRAMALTRHKDPRTLLIYNDEKMTFAREAMELVAAGVPCYRMRSPTPDNH